MITRDTKPVEVEQAGRILRGMFRVCGSVVEVANDRCWLASPIRDGDARATAAELLAKVSVAAR